MQLKEFGDYMEETGSTRPRKQNTMNIDSYHFTPDASPMNFR